MAEKHYRGEHDEKLSIWSFFGEHKAMHPKRGEAMVFLWVRSERMPCDFYAIYGLPGISYVGNWYRATELRYHGVLRKDEAEWTMLSA